MTAKTLDEMLNWRYATKKMDPAKAVPEEKVDAIIEAIEEAGAIGCLPCQTIDGCGWMDW